jgi:hypothetical protein
MLKSHLGVYRRLLTLGILVVCLCYLAAHRAQAVTEFTCDTDYSTCYLRTAGDPSGECISAAEDCMLSHPRYMPFMGPICDPSGAQIKTTCLRGNIHTWDSSYPDIAPYFEACMENSAPDAVSSDCCDYTANYFTALYCP